MYTLFIRNGFINSHNAKTSSLFKLKNIFKKFSLVKLVIFHGKYHLQIVEFHIEESSFTHITSAEVYMIWLNMYIDEFLLLSGFIR